MPRGRKPGGGPGRPLLPEGQPRAALTPELLDPPPVTKDLVIAELASLAFSNIKDFIEWDDSGVRVKASAMLTREMARAIQSVSVREWQGGPVARSVQVKLYDKQKALESLCKYLGLFVTKLEIPELMDTMEKWGEMARKFSDLEVRNHMKSLEARVQGKDV